VDSRKIPHPLFPKHPKNGIHQPPALFLFTAIKSITAKSMVLFESRDGISQNCYRSSVLSKWV
jgi:hypothetical protein